MVSTFNYLKYNCAMFISFIYCNSYHGEISRHLRFITPGHPSFVRIGDITLIGKSYFTCLRLDSCLSASGYRSAISAWLEDFQSVVYPLSSIRPVSQTIRLWRKVWVRFLGQSSLIQFVNGPPPSRLFYFRICAILAIITLKWIL